MVDLEGHPLRDDAPHPVDAPAGPIPVTLPDAPLDGTDARLDGPPGEPEEVSSQGPGEAMVPGPTDRQAASPTGAEPLGTHPDHPSGSRAQSWMNSKT